MSDELVTSKYLARYWALVALYVLLFVAFLFAALGFVVNERNTWLEYALAVALILGPAFAYPAAFYLNTTAEERKYVKQLSQMWAPVWVALSALVVAISKGGW